MSRSACTASLLLGMVTTACASTYPRQRPEGLLFPAVRGTSLSGRTVDIPEAFRGKPVLLIVGYEMESQFDADRWLLGLHQAGLTLEVYELPTIPGLVPGLFAGRIDEGMRSGIPSEEWASVVTVYEDAEVICSFLGNENPLPARVVLLDPSGKVVFFHDQGYSVAALERLAEAADRWVRSGRSASGAELTRDRP